MTRVLVVDDDRPLLRALRISLTAAGYDVTIAPDGTSALTMASGNPPDVAIVDLGLPDMDGIAVVEGLRGWSTAPIIVLSARHTEQAKIAALDVGADDYVTKPFGMGELLARIRAALRRTAPTSQQPIVVTDAFTVDLTTKQVTNAAGPVRLTPTEWHLLEMLVRNPGMLVTQRQLLQEVWGPRYETETNYLRVYLANLRRKLEPDPTRPRYLRTEPGIGYRFTP
ncbi:DNA-binding response regulator [Longispora fulva]|uniref:Transcriptional regulatory protein KdpE n=1 Tax=Longispora fulva TaxID=619741 RepID=A0A8J7GDQ3_9ACTN|nr:response regulator [Longispora fulva]MBG6134602.1 two-component system KDP operon response regulator KdpE [Longispora fulva]GIG61809.1 DNA-binding response regulator [Longispora fulva]